MPCCSPKVIARAVILLIVGYSGVHSVHALDHTLVLRYKDFEPQAAAYKLIGYSWYQWNSQGPDDPSGSDDVRVVVFRDIPLVRAKRRYPVIRGQKDYRYLSYDAALKYCDHLLQMRGPYLGHLRVTRNTIIKELGPPAK